VEGSGRNLSVAYPKKRGGGIFMWQEMEMFIRHNILVCDFVIPFII